MSDPRIETVARILVDYSVNIQPGEFVQIEGTPEGRPLILAVYQRVLQRGGHPWLRLNLDEAAEIYFKYASDEQLDYVPNVLRQLIEEVDARIVIWTEINTKALTNVDPAKQARVQAARRPLSERFLERAAQKELKWTGTAYPTQAFAQDAEMSLREFEEFVYGAALVHEPDPIAAWQTISKDQQRLIDWLVGKDQVHLLGPDTDLTLSIKGRSWVNCDGHENFPDGEIFTGPIEESVNGHVRFSYPACEGGREVEDVRLWFENGKVVKATAAKNEEFLLAMLDTDEGARYLGEFAFGTNSGIQRFTKNILFDEKIGGTVHMALGTGYPESGSQNRSAIHWDMICDLREGGEVWVDGVLFARDGKFMI
ncbi:MAG TPA: aminopeptidase [Anaerolineae bacterium]|nr:aminopeptidase [Anaerolineae bacterium]